MKRTLSEEAQQVERQRLNLPKHFCTAAVCAHAASPLPSKSLPSSPTKDYLGTVGETETVWKIEMRGESIIISDGGTSHMTHEFLVSKEELIRASKKEKSLVALTLQGGRKVTVCVRDVRIFLARTLQRR